MTLRTRGTFLTRALLACVVLAAGFTSGSVWAQLAPAPSPSPLAPGDLKSPIFDTETPVYDTAGQQAKSASKVVAEVDGRAITLGDVGDAIAELPTAARNLPFADLFPDIRSQLIRQEALVIRAQRQGLDTDPEVQRKINAARNRVLSNALLEREGAATITEAALLDRYNKDIANKPGPDEVHVRVIKVPTEDEAKSIIGELRGGADFAALATRSSQDATASAGGDAGFFALDQLTPEVGAVVFSMQPGQFTPLPVRSVGSWFVLKVDERRRQPAPPFSVAREGLRQTLLRENAVNVARAALAAATVREYDFSGKETDTSSSQGGARPAN